VAEFAVDYTISRLRATQRRRSTFLQANSPQVAAFLLQASPFLIIYIYSNDNNYKFDLLADLS
jgi:hypothetical protein